MFIYIIGSGSGSFGIDIGKFIICGYIDVGYYIGISVIPGNTDICKLLGSGAGSGNKYNSSYSAS